MEKSLGLLSPSIVCVCVNVCCRKMCQAVATVCRQGGLGLLLSKSQLMRDLQMCYSVTRQVLGWLVVVRWWDASQCALRENRDLMVGDPAGMQRGTVTSCPLTPPTLRAVYHRPFVCQDHILVTNHQCNIHLMHLMIWMFFNCIDWLNALSACAMSSGEKGKERNVQRKKRNNIGVM